MDWFAFASLDLCVKSYFDFINIDRYANLKNVNNYITYCNLLKEDGYATSLTYASSLVSYITQYNLTKYDAQVAKIPVAVSGYSNSSLVNYTKISPCKDENRKHKIDTITIHCYVGQVSVERMGSGWASLSANASANYGIGTDGRIGLYVDEKDRAWTTGGKWAVNGITGSENDQRAVTIECACDTTAPYAINDKVMASLIKLVADIARRNNMGTLKWKGDSALVGKPNEQNMTVHRWFTSKSCPGDYIYNRLGYIASEANKINGSVAVESSTVATEITYVYHTVAKGETLGKIANVYKTTIEIIQYHNPIIVNPNKIQTGWVLKIPMNIANAPSTYTVVKGDWLSKIAEKTNVPLDTLKKLNPEVKPPLYIIRTGQVLKLN